MNDSSGVRKCNVYDGSTRRGTKYLLYTILLASSSVKKKKYLFRRTYLFEKMRLDTRTSLMLNIPFSFLSFSFFFVAVTTRNYILFSLLCNYFINEIKEVIHNYFNKIE